MRIALYNLHFATLGGGERRTAMLAAHLAARHEVALFSASPIDQSRIRCLFGIDLRGVDNIALPTEESAHAAAVAQWRPDLFVNNSYCSRLPCPAPRGIYMCMFPEGGSVGLDGYQVVTANSTFTQQWIARLWDRDSKIVYSAVEPMGPAAPKKWMILNVGRFQSDRGDNHFKQQIALLEAFRQLQPLVDEPWEMHFAGNLGPEDSDRAYAEGLRLQAAGEKVQFHFGIGQDGLRDLYRRAALYWHATGCDDPAGARPARQEHFGMSIVEAMSAGAVPFAFRGGGPCETIDHGKSGWLWSSLEELVQGTRMLAADGGLRESMSEEATRRSAQFDKREFLKRMDAVVERMLAS